MKPPGAQVFRAASQSSKDEVFASGGHTVIVYPNRTSPGEEPEFDSEEV